MNAPLSIHVFERLMVSKSFLDKIRFVSVREADKVNVAQQILISHDAAELAIAAIADHLSVKDIHGNSYLMTYIAAIEKQLSKSLDGHGFMIQLNDARISIKHKGLFLDSRSWGRVAQKTFDYIADWCQSLLQLDFATLDLSELIRSTEVKKFILLARDALIKDDYQSTLLNLAFAQFAQFEETQGFMGLAVGKPDATIALKLAAFGSNPNEYLALQEFLPAVWRSYSGKISTNWVQLKYGHPANWSKANCEFCLRAVVHLCICVQDAHPIPYAIEFQALYEHEITALVDGAQLFKESRDQEGRIVRESVVREFNKGERLRGNVSKREDETFLLLTGRSKEPRSYSFFSLSPNIFGSFVPAEFKIRCVPKDNEFVQTYFGDLTEMDYLE